MSGGALPVEGVGKVVEVEVEVGGWVDGWGQKGREGSGRAVECVDLKVWKR